MNETQRRIQAYKEALPGLRERVIAVALLLAMSAAMMTSASFAWLTISRSPELTGVNTTVAANGNLEIALATGDGKTAPGDSQVGDSSATKGQSITASNITWGNLINLGDPSYGLDHLTLRPAQLNKTALLTSPLYSAVFNDDGRVKNLTSNFSYTSWVPPEGNNEGYFGLSTSVGVRAISSVKSMVVGYAGAVLELKDIASSSNPVAGETFQNIIKDTAKMEVLAKVLGIHMTANLNTEDKYVNATITQEELETLISMYDALILAHEQEATAIAETLNLQLYVANGGITNYTRYTAESVLAISPTDSRIDQTTGDFTVPVAGGTKTLRITDLKTFLKDYAMLQEDVATLWEIHAGGDYAWKRSGLRTVVNKLMDVDQCLVKKRKETKFKTVKELMAEFNANIFDAMGWMGAECDIVITNGVLYNFEQRIGTSIQVERMQVTAKMYVSTANLGEQTANIYAYVTTGAASPYNFYADLDYSVSPEMDTGPSQGSGLDQGGGESSGATVMAQDTYALAVDFWVRTNHAHTFLTLEGNVLTEAKEQNVTGQDASGNTVDIYTLSRVETIPAETDADGNAVEGSEEQTFVNTYDLYQAVGKNDAGQDVTIWYDAITYEPFQLEDGEEPKRKVETIHVVVGYEGENRVWDTSDGSGREFIGTDATTQGAGSCYVYYADTPEDQARSLELLNAMKVAFVDDKGVLLATAEMDTESFFAEGGRVIVPLKLNAESTVIGTTDEDDPIYGITRLEQNVPTRITAIVYLDGTLLTNQNVLSAADIQGKLNIQFGTSDTMTPIDNEPLENATRRVSASVSNSNFDYDTHVGEMRTTVTVRVDGEQPTQMKAFFMRQINSTQGSREREMIFTYNQDTGAWTTDYVFTAPGNYVLRTVSLDGVEYDLGAGDDDPEAARPKVVITGFTVRSLSCNQANSNRDVSIMSASNSAPVDLTLKFATDDVSKLPSTVQGRFLRSDGTAVNVNFIYNPTTTMWNGSATFLTSGSYDFTYLVLDGKYVELDPDLWLHASVSLGMRVAVYTTSPSSFKFLPAEMETNMKTLAMQVKIMDNSGTTIPGITGATMSYRLQGSSIKTMDTNLTWDAASGYYIGALKTLESGGPGTWSFGNVTMGQNIISSAATSPTFKLISPEPPGYKGFQIVRNQYAPNGDAKMNVTLTYASTATVAAVIVDANGREYEVQGYLNQENEQDNSSEWFFAIPTNTNGEYKDKQDGYWTMKEIRVWNYYDAAGNWISAEIDEDKDNDIPDGQLIPGGKRDEPMVFDMSDKDYTSKVVQTVTITFAAGQGKNFGKDADGNVTAGFMTEHTVSGLTATIADFEGKAIATDAKMVITYTNGTSESNGGYSNNDLKNSAIVYNVPLAADNSGTVFTQSQDLKLVYAGNYTTEFTFKVNGVEQTATSSGIKVNGAVPTFSVWSVAPTLKITARSNYNTSSNTDTSAHVEFGFTAGNGCTSYDNYNQPYVTITLSGYGNAESAALVFTASNNGTVHLYTTNGGSTATTSYAWSANGACQRYVGYFQSVRAGNDKHTVAGTLTAKELKLTYGGQTYLVSISTMYPGVTEIKIENPS